MQNMRAPLLLFSGILVLFAIFISCASLSELEYSLFRPRTVSSSSVPAGTGGWVTVGTAGFTAAAPLDPDLAVNSNNSPLVIYCDSAADGKAVVKVFDNGVWTNAGSGILSSNMAGGSTIVMGRSSPATATPFAAYLDQGNSSSSSSGVTIRACRYTDNWQEYSPGYGLSSSVSMIRLAVGGAATPYVAFLTTDSSKISVIRFTNAVWSLAGSPDFNDGMAMDLDFQTDPNGNPCVVYSDSANSSKATVERFNGTNWEYAGQSAFTEGQSYEPTLAFDQNGWIYVAYRDGTMSLRATVMVHDGTNWNDLGEPGFSPDPVVSLSVRVSPLGIPHVVFLNDMVPRRVTVMRFNGSAWELLGPQGFSVSAAKPRLAFNSSGQPYVLFQETLNGNRLTVMTYTP